MCEETKKLNENEAEAVVGGVGTKEQKVPNVVGMSVMDAEMKLNMQTFKVGLCGSKQPDAIVVKQSAEPGTMLAERSYVIIWAE